MLLSCARQISSRRSLAVSLALIFTSSGLLWTWNNSQASLPVWLPGHYQVAIEDTVAPLNPWRDVVHPCIGPRGVELPGSSEDSVQDKILDGGEPHTSRHVNTTLTLQADLPKPYGGSYAEMNLPFTWSTAQERYGAYGFAQETSVGPNQSVDWTKVDWADLQNQCLQRNTKEEYKHTIKPLSASRRLRLPTWEEGGHWLLSRKTPPRPKITSGRTAIVLRGWSTFEFKGEDYWNLRSLIAETALRHGGRYTVILLVDIKDPGLDVWKTPQNYEKVLLNIPREFRNMTLLFDQHRFLTKWYPRVGEHRPEWQMEQARQVLAHLFDEFDFYWAIEIDIRFTGNSGIFFDAVEDFARNEPRKQARERSSFFYNELYNTYANFTSMVDQALNHGSAYWRGVKIPDVESIGPEPPTLRAEDDNFEWGVGEETDLLIMSSTMNVTMNGKWHYQNWINNFKDGVQTPRVSSAPAVSRCSWNLLNQVHEAQVWQGLSLPSESTPISFALWHNLKISRVPFPIFGQYSHNFTLEDIDVFLNGGPPTAEYDGMSWGVNAYGFQFGQQTPVKDIGPTWTWRLGYPQDLFRAWIENDVEAVGRGDLPTLTIRDGRVMMPMTLLHPVKSNPKPPPNPS